MSLLSKHSEETLELIDLIHTHNIDITNNEIYLVGSEQYINREDDSDPGVDFSMASRFIKNLRILTTQSASPILIHMKSCGGYWEEGMAIYDAIRACPNKTVILNYNHARSMSSIIFQAADRRVMMPNSTFMFHEGSIEFSGTPKLLRTENEQEIKCLETMLDIYIEALKRGKMKNKSKKKLRDWLIAQMNQKEDVYLDAQSAVDYGFADFIFGKRLDYNWDDLRKF